MSHKQETRYRAVLDLMGGTPVPEVVRRWGICRSDLYKYRKRALEAMYEALKDRPRGPKNPHNLLPAEQEERVKGLCARYTTLSSYKIKEKMGRAAPSPRTIQRIRKT